MDDHTTSFPNVSDANTSCVTSETYSEKGHVVVLDVYELARLVFLAVNTALAFVGNSLSLAVFTRSRLRGAPSSGYLAALAVADTGSAIVGTLGIANGIYGFLSEIPFCYMVFFLSLSFQFLSVWILVCFTAERYVSICHPFRAPRILARFQERRVVAGLVLLSWILYVHYLVGSREMYFNDVWGRWGCRWCDARLKKYGTDFAYVTFALHFLLPMTSIIVLNALIVTRLCRESKNSPASSRRGGEREAQNKYITRTLLLVCLVFFLCHFPFNLLYVLRTMDVPVNTAFYKVTQIVFKVSYSTNVFLYVASGSKFRTSLKDLCRAHRRPGDQSNSLFGTSGSELRHIHDGTS